MSEAAQQAAIDAVEALPDAQKSELALNTMAALPDDQKGQFALDAVAALPDELKKEAAVSAVADLPSELRKEAAVDAVAALPNRLQKEAASDAVAALPDDVKKAVITQLRTDNPQLFPKGERSRTMIWMTLLVGLFFMALAVLACYVILTIEAEDADTTALIAIASAIVAGVIGLFANPPRGDD